MSHIKIRVVLIIKIVIYDGFVIGLGFITMIFTEDGRTIG